MFYYMGLESYPDRYTFQLRAWAEKALVKYGVPYMMVDGVQTNTVIKTGQVLDAHGRTYYSLTQHAQLIELLQSFETTSNDVIFYEDMYTPGIESLPYIFDQMPANKRPKVYVRCLAQSIDPDDFVHITGMGAWMGAYERMLNEFVDGILCSNEEMVAHAKIAGWKARLFNISGLTFDADEVRSYAPIVPFYKRTLDVCFASRWDLEKQPDFFLDVIEDIHSRDPSVNFHLYQGGKLRSNSLELLERARAFEKAGALTIHENLSKRAYYALLGNTKVLFNCALQDWVSNTASEADALGCNHVFPAYRSFPETFDNDPTRMYIPWSVESAAALIKKSLVTTQNNQGLLAEHTSRTMERILGICYREEVARYYGRNNLTYRTKASTGRK